MHSDTQRRMSKHAAYVRSTSKMKELYDELHSRKENFFADNPVASKEQLWDLYKYYDALVTQIEVLSAMIFAAERMGSRGSALVEDAPMDTGQCNNQVVTTLNGKSYFEPVRPLELGNDWFETVWNSKSEG